MSAELVRGAVADTFRPGGTTNENCIPLLGGWVFEKTWAQPMPVVAWDAMHQLVRFAIVINLKSYELTELCIRWRALGVLLVYLGRLKKLYRFDDLHLSEGVTKMRYVWACQFLPTFLTEQFPGSHAGRTSAPLLKSRCVYSMCGLWPIIARQSDPSSKSSPPR